MRLIGPLAGLTYLLFSFSIQAQQNPAARNQVAGSVSSIDASAKSLALQSDKGEALTVQASERTVILRIPPGETDPKKGTRMGLADLSPGDRVVAVSKQPIEKGPVEASAILVMTKSDVALQHQNDEQDWKKRGLSGVVVSTDAGANTITVKTGQKTMTVKPDAKAEFRRYSVDSPRFSDAKPSNISEVKAGDQIRVLGDRDADGMNLKAEKVVFGTFRQIAATVNAVDSQTGELKVTDLASKKPLTIRVTSDSSMKKLPDMAARMLARRYGAAAQSEPAEGRGGRGGGRDVGQVLESLPAMPLADLKAGDAIMVTTTMGSDPSRVTATMLLAGVEPLLTASPNSTRDIMSGWNLTGGGEGN